MRRFTPALLIAATALAVPSAASAHGLVQRSNLPIPEWLFGWAAAIVLVISFVALAALWPKPRMEDSPSWKPVPGGAALGSRPVEILCGAIGVALLVVVFLAGYIGSGVALDNFAPTFILITFWVGLVFASAIFGDVFKAFSPWRAIGRLLPSQGLRPYPEKLGRWPAAIGLLVFTWIELSSGWGEDPALLVTAALGYTILTLVAQVVFGVETWTRYGETFAVYYNLFSRISPFETRERVVGVRPPLSGLPHLRPRPRHGRPDLGDDRHRHLRRALPGPAVEGPRGRPHRRRHGPRHPDHRRAEGRLDDRARGLRAPRRALLPRGHRGRALGRRRHLAPSACGARSCTRWCRSRWSTSPPTT